MEREGEKKERELIQVCNHAHITRSHPQQWSALEARIYPHRGLQPLPGNVVWHGTVV